MSTLRFLTIVLLLAAATVVRAGSNEDGLKFLEENKAKEGVIELPSGMQYKILEKGAGIHHPAVSAPCSCHYSGNLIDGTIFDSSYERGKPTTFAPNQVIPGWTEAMQLMVEGDKWELTIPSDLAYGDRGSPPKIPGGSVLVFQIEILEIKGDKIMALRCDAVTKESCNDKEVAWIAKIADWDDEKKEKEAKRLDKILGDSSSQIKDSLVEWLHRRLYVLKQTVPAAEEEEEEL
jgi:FKBP-type peptidyl-prolyl cis-trans isomerase FklB